MGCPMRPAFRALIEAFTPIQKDQWPHRTENKPVKRPIIGRLLGMGKTVNRPTAVPIPKKEYKAYLKKGGKPEEFFNKSNH